MPINFYGTRINNTWNNDDNLIQGKKKFSNTIIGDISSNNTSYFTDICVNQISTPDIAGQVLTIDCNLNVKGNISYKDAGGSQQDLLAIIADLSSRYHDLKTIFETMVPTHPTSTEIQSLINDNAIEAKYIQVGADQTYNSGYGTNQNGKGSLTCYNLYIADELWGPGGREGVEDGVWTGAEWAQGIKKNTGFYGVFYLNQVSFYSGLGGNNYNNYAWYHWRTGDPAGLYGPQGHSSTHTGPSHPIVNYYYVTPPTGGDD